MNRQEILIDKEIIAKYLYYWPWFITGFFVTVLGASLYLIYTEPVYNSEAKVKIIRDKENSEFSLDVNQLFTKSTINIENEIALFTSHRLLEQVVKRLNLNISYHQEENFKSRQVYDAPFLLKYDIADTDFKDPFEFNIQPFKSGYKITNTQNGKELIMDNLWYKGKNETFPFIIEPIADMGSFGNTGFNVVVRNVQQVTRELMESLKVEPEGNNSDVLKLSMRSTNGNRSKLILDTLIEVYEQDGIADGQEVSKRTIEFVDERFDYLMRELDSIEHRKEEYKQNNDLSFLETDVTATLQKLSFKDESLFQVETQLLLSKELKHSIAIQADSTLLPTNIGLNSNNINQLVEEHNRTVLEYNKLKASAGSNNAVLRSIKTNIIDLKANIAMSIDAYLTQLKTTLDQDKKSQKLVDGSFKSIPKKEKVLRNIERQQNLKERLYLLLLQKREEESINLAQTMSNLKVIDYGITDSIPVSPKPKILYLGAIIFGIFFPFGILYIKFRLDTKIYLRKDIEAINNEIPILVELPEHSEKKYKPLDIENRWDGEAFRILAHGASHITPKSDDNIGAVIFVTSAIKGEGKTHVSFNLANTFSLLGKKVLLVGIDFRNPQLHNYINKQKNQKGLSHCLDGNNLQWADLLFKHDQLDVLLNGSIYPNPNLLLNGERFRSVIDEMKLVYDYVIFDTPPTLLMSDTLTISKLADTILYIVRSGFTDKKLIDYSSKFFRQEGLDHVGYVINGVNYKKSYDYGYNYDYRYNY